MLKPLLYTALILVTLGSTAQTSLEIQLDSIQDEAQATKFLDTYKSNKGKVFVFNKEKHKSQLAKELFDMGKGSNKVIATDIERTHYKIIDKYEILYYRVSYVYLDGNKKTQSEIKDIQSKVITKYNQGYRFKDLAKMYSMDKNATRGGDMGWFTHGEMDGEFENAVLNSAKGVNDIFVVDIPEKNLYYVVLKTHETKRIEEIKVLQVTEKI
ncbi:MAG TPA: peptidylprolyl isomerase [Aquaticitalea sp.]|nr:peptidylprolyl isomerase [Aquaticitalea sp.]